VRRASARLQSCHHRPRAPGSHGRTAPSLISTAAATTLAAETL
jgi:hypothetical protein